MSEPAEVKMRGRDRRIDHASQFESSANFQAAQRPSACGEVVDIQAESLQHADVQVGQGAVAGLVEGQVLAVFEASAGQDDWQVAVVVTAAVHV
jgi:hypothetical protein